MHANYTNNNKLIYSKLSYILTGICYGVHNELGRFCRERQYSDAIRKKLEYLKVEFKQEFRSNKAGNVFDFLINDCIILEIKAKPHILKSDYYQIQRYLQNSKIKLGLLVNFRNRYLKPMRIVRIDTEAKAKFV